MKSKVPAKRTGCRHNEYRVENNVVIFTTRNKADKTEFKIDLSDFEKVYQYSWSYHRWSGNGNVICHRYLDENGKWCVITLSSLLGFGRGYKHKNGDINDFRKENMVKNTTMRDYSITYKSKRVKCVETSEEFFSIHAAMRKYGIGIDKSVVDKPNRTAYGFHWIFIN